MLLVSADYLQHDTQPPPYQADDATVRLPTTIPHIVVVTDLDQHAEGVAQIQIDLQYLGSQFE